MNVAVCTHYCHEHRFRTPNTNILTISLMYSSNHCIHKERQCYYFYLIALDTEMVGIDTTCSKLLLPFLSWLFSFSLLQQSLQMLPTKANNCATAFFFKLSYSHDIILCRNATLHVHLQICHSLEETSCCKRKYYCNFLPLIA